MKKFLFFIVAGLLIMLLASCQKDADPTSQEQIDKIPIGITQKQVWGKFGEPTKLSFTKNNEVWTYCSKEYDFNIFSFRKYQYACTAAESTFVFKNNKLISKKLSKNKYSDIVIAVCVSIILLFIIWILWLYYYL